MDRLESDLRAALGRKPAPAGFAARLDGRLRGRVPATAVPRLVTRWVLPLAAAVVLAGGIGLFDHGRRVRERNRAALEETLTALSIAATQLERAESRVLAPALWERLGGPFPSGAREEERPGGSMHSDTPPSRI